MKLNYDVVHPNVGATALCNGNISSIEWITGSSAKSVYGFVYDGLNRMTQANYGEGATATSNVDRYKELLTYNLNGDIQTLQRWGKNGGTPTAPTFGQIDNMSYTYTSTGAMRLASIGDASTMSFGFTTTAGTSQSYTYDLMGNLTGRTNTPYNTITYNHLNLPHSITGT